MTQLIILVIRDTFLISVRGITLSKGCCQYVAMQDVAFCYISIILSGRNLGITQKHHTGYRTVKYLIDVFVRYILVNLRLNYNKTPGYWSRLESLTMEFRVQDSYHCDNHSCYCSYSTPSLIVQNNQLIYSSLPRLHLS